MTAKRSVLVIDDEASICDAFRRFFGHRNWDVFVAASGREGVAAYNEHRPDVVFLDVRLPDGNGLDILDELRTADPDAKVIIITAYGGLNTVMRSMEGKAFDYLPKPIDLDRASDLAARAVESRHAVPPDAPPSNTEETFMVGTSPAMQQVYKKIAVLAHADSNVLILGQTGTGKEMVATAIHRHSSRKDKPFVAVNCGAIPDNLVESELFGHVRGAFTGADSDRAGRFESADGGTLFLDEIGELPPAAQVKLLRVLDSHTIERVGSVKPIHLDVRVISATNRDLTADVESGKFRADLYYRLAVVRVELPTLAERHEDILPLARHFLAMCARSPREIPQLDKSAIEAMLRYHWPGNVRELKNSVEYATVVAPGGRIRAEDLPQQVLAGQSASFDRSRIDSLIHDYIASLPQEPGKLYRSAIEPLEEAIIRHAMEQCGWNQSEAAALLGVHRNTLRTKLRELKINATEGPMAH